MELINGLYLLLGALLGTILGAVIMYIVMVSTGVRTEIKGMKVTPPESLVKTIDQLADRSNELVKILKVLADHEVGKTIIENQGRILHLLGAENDTETADKD